MQESKDLEFKKEISNTFLKTVSAFSNFGTGKIIFGIADDGKTVGLDATEDARLVIENKINDSITPKPDFALLENAKNGTITLTVYEGRYKPYLYKGKAYRRQDTSSVEVDQLELKRLTLEGDNLYYEELPSEERQLTFEYFEQKVKEKLGIKKLSTDILRTFGFYTEERKWNHAAALFADKNTFYGIDIVRFGESINVIFDRERMSGLSVLEQYDRALAMFSRNYQYEEIEGKERVKRERIPETAFREAVANALVHRTWDINSYIRIAMFSDRIELTSPGGLPKGITEEEYLRGSISNLRNPIVGNVFFRLHYIEMFGTGIPRIFEAYRGAARKPTFSFTPNSVTVILPVFTEEYHANTEEKIVLSCLSHGGRMTSREIAEECGWKKEKALRLLNRLREMDYVKRTGAGRATVYFL